MSKATTPNPLPCGCRAEIQEATDAETKQVVFRGPVIKRFCPLHAAAGQLLAACKAMLDLHDGHCAMSCDTKIERDVRAAIAKAEKHR